MRLITAGGIGRFPGLAPEVALAFAAGPASVGRLARLFGTVFVIVERDKRLSIHLQLVSELHAVFAAW